MAPLLGYWNLRGLANPIRNLLAYTGEPYEEKLYIIDPAIPREERDWFKEKFTLGLDFPNLPYLVDGSRKFTESGAILRYLARKHGLGGNTEDETIALDVMQGVIEDLRLGLIKLIHDQGFEKLKAGYITELPAKLKPISEYIGSKKWILGDRISYVDFMLYEILYFLNELSPESIAGCKNLGCYIKRFEAIDNIAKYHKSDKFIDRPFFGPMALWGK